MTFGHDAAALMPRTLQTAINSASPRHCIPRSDLVATSLQTAIMRDEDKDYRTANNLRAWREHRRMTQTDLAKAVDTTQAVISLLEKAERQLSTKWLYRLAPALRIQPGHLVDYDPRTLDTFTLELIEAAASIAEEDRPFTKELMNAASGISPEDRATAIRVLNGFLKSA